MYLRSKIGNEASFDEEKLNNPSDSIIVLLHWLDYNFNDFNSAIQTITQRSNNIEENDSYAFKELLSNSNE